MSGHPNDLVVHPLMPVLALMNQVNERWEVSGERTATVQIASQSVDGTPLLFEMTVTMRHVGVH